MKNASYKFLAPKGDDFINDYDRLFSTISKLKCDLINCTVEDFCNEASAFYPASKYLKILYACICQCHPHIERIDQYSRCKNPTPKSLLRLSTYTREQLLLSHNNNEKFVAFLGQLNTKMTSINSKDNLTLFYVSLLIWDEYLMTKVDASRLYVSSIVNNYVLIVIKKALTLHNDPSHKSTVISRDIDLLQSDMVYYVLLKIREDAKMLSIVERMVNAYDQVCSRAHDLKSLDSDKYFSADIPVIHRISVSCFQSL